MDTATLSKLADTIIVTCFFVVTGATWIYILTEAITGIIDLIRDRRRKRKELKALKEKDCFCRSFFTGRRDCRTRR